MPRHLIWAMLLGELLLFAAAGYLSIRLVTEARTSRDGVEHSHEVLHSLADLRLSVARLTSWTLYHLGGDSPINVQTAKNEFGRVRDLLARLRTLVAADPIQLQSVDSVAPSLDARLALHQQLIATVGPGDMAAARPIVRALSKNADPMRAWFADFASSERDKLAARSEASEATMRRLLGLLLAVFASAFTFILIATVQYIHRLRLQSSRWLELTRTNAEIARQHEAVRNTTRRLDAVLDNAQDVILLVSGDLRILIANRACVTLLGVPPGEVVGRSITEYLPNFDGAEGRVRRRQVVRTDGEEFAVEVSVGTCQLQDSPAFVCIIRDVTERQKLDRLKDDFVSTVSHELRTPLTSILGSVGLVVNGVAGELPPRAQSLIELAHHNAQRLLDLVNDLLDIQKYDANQAGFRHENVNVGLLVNSSLDVCRPNARKSGVEICYHDNGTAAIGVSGDFDRLQQVLINLLSNAIKFSLAGGRVEVAVADEPPHITFSVRDYGPGVPEEFRSRIFGRFAQAETGDARRKRGTGLGLSIVKAIVERHNGQVGFDSPLPDGGTRFWFSLPLLVDDNRPSPGNDPRACAVSPHPNIVPT